MQFIVGEISCNYTNGELEAPEMGFLSERFERIVNKNWERGYKLFQFNISSFLNKWKDTNGQNETLNETIIAVFEKITDQQQPTTNKGQNNA